MSGLIKHVCACCGAGKQKCFVCKVVDSESTVSCSEPSCGQLYHVTCVGKLLPLDEVVDKPKFVCPLHRCATCQAIGKTVFAGMYCWVSCVSERVQKSLIPQWHLQGHRK